MIILVDQDGVLANFELGFLEKWRAKHPNEVFVPLDERRSFYAEYDYPDHLTEEVRNIYTASGFFRELQIIEGCKEALERMEEMGHEIYICTAPVLKYKHCVLEKFQWIEEHLGERWTRRIVLTRHKYLIRGDILIDDRPHLKGAEHAAWEHVLFDHPYNRSVRNKKRLTWANWQEVLDL